MHNAFGSKDIAHSTAVNVLYTYILSIPHMRIFYIIHHLCNSVITKIEKHKHGWKKYQDHMQDSIESFNQVHGHTNTDFSRL